MSTINYNPDNTVTIIGRVETKDLSKTTYTNNDGSKKMQFTLAVKNGYASTDESGEKVYGKTDIPVEVFVPARKNGDEAGLGIYSTLATGDLIEVVGHIENNNYTKDGVKVYGIIIRADMMRYRESKAVKANRAAKKAASVENVAAEA